MSKDIVAYLYPGPIEGSSCQAGDADHRMSREGKHPYTLSFNCGNFSSLVHLCETHMRELRDLVGLALKEQANYLESRYLSKEGPNG